MSNRHNFRINSKKIEDSENYNFINGINMKNKKDETNYMKTILKSKENEIYSWQRNFDSLNNICKKDKDKILNLEKLNLKLNRENCEISEQLKMKEIKIGELVNALNKLSSQIILKNNRINNNNTNKSDIEDLKRYIFELDAKIKSQVVLINNYEEKIKENDSLRFDNIKNNSELKIEINRLLSDKDWYKSQVSRLKDDLEKSKVSNQNKIDELIKLTKEIEKLKNINISELQLKDNLILEINIFKKKYYELKISFENLNKKYESEIQEIDGKYKKNYINLNKKFKKLKTTNKNIKEELNCNNNFLQEYNNYFKKMNEFKIKNIEFDVYEVQIINDLNSNMVKLIKEVNNKNSYIEDKDNKILELLEFKNLQTKSKREIEDFKNMNLKKDNEITDFKVKIEELENIIKEHNKNIQSKDEEIKLKTKKINELNQESFDLNDQISLEKKNYILLKNEYDYLFWSSTKYSDKINYLQENIKNYEQQLNNYKHSEGSYNEIITDNKSKMDNLAYEMKKLSENNSKLHVNEIHSTNKIEELSKNEYKLKFDLENIQEENKKLKAIINKKNKEYDDIIKLEASVKSKEIAIKHSLQKLEICQGSYMLNLSCNYCFQLTIDCITVLPCAHNFCKKCYESNKTDDCPDCKNPVLYMYDNKNLNDMRSKFTIAQEAIDTIKKDELISQFK